jgi:cytochrome c oxidase subunit 2
VRIKLASDDVIHSFWVPQLAGNMDAIPGLTNETWIEADRPGLYRGQCTEYCGAEHARMGLVLVAEAPADFRAWWAHQLAAPAPGAAPAGRQAFGMHCGGCHAVRGTDAAGSLGPDLSHLMNRGTIASGMYPNNPAMLARWITDPQSLKPGALMPAPALSAAERTAVESYLEALR